MNDTMLQKKEAPESAAVSDEERQMLLDAVRGLLENNWPALGAVARSDDQAAVRRVTSDLTKLGLGGLGRDSATGGLQEILLVLEELGRAACPAPLLAASLTNVLLGPLVGQDSAVHSLLAGLEAGTEYLALSFGPLDGDRTGGAIVAEGDHVSGDLRYLEGAAGITVAVAAISPTRLAVISLSSAHATLTPTRALGANGLFTLTLKRAPAHWVEVSSRALADAVLIARLGLAARAYGAANRAFEMIVEYAKDRKQFGKPIGSFQAIQHKLANSYIALEVVKRSLEGAASQYDAGNPDWRIQAAATVAFASGSLRQVSLETHHAFGAIGYAEDHEAPRHFKRVHQDLLRLGGARQAREELAARFLNTDKGFPELNLGPRGNQFREEVRAWLKLHWPPERRDAFQATHRPHHHDHDFSREIGETGWLGLNWPRKFGGQERSPMENLAFLQEMARAEAPRAGSQIQAVGWMSYGRPEQQEKYLPALRAGEAFYGMWYSEPNSGSDLASLQTRAVRDGDGYVINGQKIWTTSYYADYMWLAARTDPHAQPQHAGITVFCVPTDTPGFTLTRVENMYDGEFAQSFFDNMRVPAECVVGQENQGWQVLMAALGTERGIAGAHITLDAANLFELACEYIRGVQTGGAALKDDPIIRDAIGRLAAELLVGRQLSLHCFEMAGTDKTPLDLAAATKIFSSELVERMCETLEELLGMEATLSRGSEGAILSGKLEQRLRNSLMYVISMGTNEIQRNVIAHRGLGLPR